MASWIFSEKIRKIVLSIKKNNTIHMATLPTRKAGYIEISISTSKPSHYDLKTVVN